MLKLKNYEALDKYLNITGSNMSRGEALDFVLNLRYRLWLITTYMMVMCLLYGFMVCFGLIGNVWVIKTIAYIFKSLSVHYSHSVVLIYIACLSLVDSFANALLPFVISDTLMFHWIFGDAFCKIFWSVEGATKMMSTFLLTLVSRNRFATVCNGRVRLGGATRPTMENVKSSLREIGVAFAATCVLLWPVPWYARVATTEEIWVAGGVEFSVDIPKCYLDMDPHITTVFTTYMFALTYFVPLATITYYYARIVMRVRAHAYKNRRSRIPLKRITCSVLLIVMFYFTCWTPYWICTMYLAWCPERGLTPREAQFVYAAHALVYVNSSANWLFYAYLNKNLRDAHHHLPTATRLSVSRKETTLRWSRRTTVAITK